MVKKHLKVGDLAPTFIIDSYNAGTIALDQLIGQQKIILIFGRYFGCPICQLDLNTMFANMDKITATGAQLIYVTQSGPDTSTKYIEEHNVQFSVIPSTKDELYADYGLGKLEMVQLSQAPAKIKEATALGIEHGPDEGFEGQCPGQFIIDTDGRLLHAQEGWFDLEALLAVFE